jgi:serine/threonine protein kinase
MVIGRYTVYKLLGSGTYGKVLKCADNKYNQHPVAIKIVRKDNNLFHEAAKKEIKMLGILNGMHGTVRMLRAFQHQGHVCLSFELLGESLHGHLERYT